MRARADVVHLPHLRDLRQQVHAAYRHMQALPTDRDWSDGERWERERRIAAYHEALAAYEAAVTAEMAGIERLPAA